MEYNNLATTPGPGWRTTHGLEPLRFVDGRVYYEEGVNSVKVFLPITGGNYKAPLKKDPKASTGQDHYYWYDRLQQVRQHQRGTLTPSTPPYTGISSLQQTEVLTFDETGNWLSYSATSPSSVTQYRTHNKANWITALTGTPDGVDPVYANTGTMTTMPKVGAWTTAQTLVWDAWNRLIEVNEGESDVSTNTYDAFHRRIRKVGGGETRDYYYDFNWRSVEERVGTPGSQTVKAQYTWSPTDRWTMIRRKRSTTGTLNEVLYVLKDYLDPAALLAPGSPNATVVERFGFDAFGPVRFMTEAFGSRGNSEYDWNFLFHAEFMDQESELYNYGYRYLHTSLGRWLSRDPSDDDGNSVNTYGFIDNAAIDHIDWLGLWREVPGRTNCLGFACNNGKEVQPTDATDTVDELLRSRGYACEKISEIKECKCDCRTEEVAVVYIYGRLTKPARGKQYYDRLRKSLGDPIKSPVGKWNSPSSGLQFVDAHAVRRNCSAKDEWKWDYVPVSLPKKEAAPIKLKEPDDYWKGDFTQVLGTYCCRKEKK